ncbi:hypothetical protein CLV60_1018 [Dyadobacter jiangsuensis]|uniref:Ferric uptake regulator family protein n=1 Tax=Dyadobacter jiangsuensis TaxID=1591085 RepID=A0A2P8GI41_9BACT|nr:hypothetical protein CLV60_1018 [Dyadobacter jiangsuensis]
MIHSDSQSSALECLTAFFTRIQKDPKIGPSHIALYLTIWKETISSGNPGHLAIYSRSLMKGAKINSSSTYSRVLKDLCNGGYICFEPSYFHNQPSRYLLVPP